MLEADLIRRGSSEIDYRGLSDESLLLILRHRFEKEIATYQPDLPRTDLKQDSMRKSSACKKRNGL